MQDLKPLHVLATKMWVSVQINILSFCLVRPGPPTELKIVSFTAMTAHLKWEKGFDGHSQISRYKLEYKIGTGVWQRFPGLKIPSSTEFVIENLVPNTSYKFRIKSFNDVGSSVWSKPSLVITTKIQGKIITYFILSFI